MVTMTLSYFPDRVLDQFVRYDGWYWNDSSASGKMSHPTETKRIFNHLVFFECGHCADHSCEKDGDLRNRTPMEMMGDVCDHEGKKSGCISKLLLGNIFVMLNEMCSFTDILCPFSDARRTKKQNGLGVLHCTEGRCFVAGPCNCEKTKDPVLPKPVKIGRFTQKKRAGASGGQKERAQSSGGQKKRAGASGGSSGKKKKRARTT